jgi:hypothetical protein
VLRPALTIPVAFPARFKRLEQSHHHPEIAVANSPELSA